MAVRDIQRLTERYTEIDTERYGAERDAERGRVGQRKREALPDRDRQERERKQMQTDADRERHAEREAEREAVRLIYKQSDTE